jgi:hypothetical protein
MMFEGVQMGRLDAYVRYNYKVPGWLHWYSARIIVDLSRIQVDAGFEGAVAEIGVHRGRLFILLKLLARPHEKAIAIDVFEDQHLNVDQSGSGDRIAFLTNLERWASTADVELIQRSSLEVSPEEIIARVGKCRIISVDAGHTAECTLNDLYLAEAVATDQSIIILDDFFNGSWPDVSTGTARFLFDGKTTMRPFAISPNKVYLAREAFHHKYQSELRLSQENFYEKNSRMFGHEVMIFGVDPVTFHVTHRIKKAIKKAIKKSAFGPYALDLKALLSQAADKKRSRMRARSHLDRH